MKCIQFIASHIDNKKKTLRMAQQVKIHMEIFWVLFLARFHEKHLAMFHTNF